MTYCLLLGCICTYDSRGHTSCLVISFHVFLCAGVLFSLGSHEPVVNFTQAGFCYFGGGGGICYYYWVVVHLHEVHTPLQ